MLFKIIDLPESETWCGCNTDAASRSTLQAIAFGLDEVPTTTPVE